MLMPIATINKTDPVVIPARAKRTYDKLDVQEIKIVRMGDQYVLRAAFLPHDSDNNESLKTHKLRWLVSDLITYLSDKPNMKDRVKNFIKAIAAQAQDDPLADKPQPEPPDLDLDPQP
jgi:hypothetical protein